jgi:hypothetical protein
VLVLGRPATRGLVAPLPIGQSVRVASRRSSSAGSDDGALLALFGGSEASKDEQGRVIALLLRNGASQTDVDANGKSVAAAASSDWIRLLLDTP